ncbi:MAG: MFS transporter [Planctomycetota bacterium]
MSAAASSPPPLPAAAPAGGRRWPQATAWVLYDLANTVYAATLTFLFTPYAAEVLGQKTGIGMVQTASMLLAGLLVPFAGALVDCTARTRTYLTVTTLLCIGCMAGWAALDPVWLLPCFFVANLTYNLALVFYNALLPAVASPERTGLVSGIGVGVGYCGTILVLLALLPLDSPQARFGTAALAFLVAALPCMLWVRDPRPPLGSGRHAMRGALGQLRAVLAELPRQRPLLLFLLANFCLVDVLNTAVLFFADLTRDVFGDAAARGELALLGMRFDGDEGIGGFVQVCGLLLNGTALLFGIGLGLLTDRRPLATMRLSAVVLLAALVGGAAFAGWSPLGYVLTLVLGGAFALSGIWTAGRKVVLLLAPPERVGAFFGLYGITTKLSVLGSTIYAVVADHHGARPAMLSQTVQLVIGLVLLTLVRLPRSGDAAAR